jgi:hypothetical protein
MSRALDEPLPLMERLSLRAHLAMCNGCRNFSRRLAILRTLARRSSELLPDER